MATLVKRLPLKLRWIPQVKTLHTGLVNPASVCTNGFLKAVPRCVVSNHTRCLFHTSSIKWSDTHDKKTFLEIEPKSDDSVGKIDPRFYLEYTCKVCSTRNSGTLSKSSYRSGVVLARCSGCQNIHLIADNLGWFSDSPDGTNIEKILMEKGESVKRFLNKD